MSHYILGVRVFEREEEPIPKMMKRGSATKNMFCHRGKVSRSAEPPEESDYSPHWIVG